MAAHGARPDQAWNWLAWQHISKSTGQGVTCEQGYQLTEHEAGCLLPCLVEKGGHNQVCCVAR